ncbi:StsA family sactipeptide RiPP [Micromonospora sp. NPDC000316]
MIRWEKPSIRKADFAAQLGCACACGALAGAGSGHAN